MTGTAAAQDEPEANNGSGRWLYQRNCESCHGETGDGRGTLSLQLGKPARSFAAGGFAFGNTREALYRTVTAGMPGSVMPGYQGALTEEERWRVVDWVRANLMPAQPPDEVERTVIELTDRPAIVRGYLPPIVEGAPMRPRGLLVGYPEGLTFEYTIDDVRLLGVRFGGFVDRTDWNGRGGTPLRPLGQVIQLFGDGDPPATLLTRKHDAWSPLAARLLRTTIHEQQASLEVDYRDEAGRSVVQVPETLRVTGASVGPVFARVSGIPKGAPRIALLVASASATAEWIRGAPAADGAEMDIERPHWIVSRDQDGDLHFVRVFVSESSRLLRTGQDLRVVLEGEHYVELTHFRTRDDSPGMIEKVSKELETWR